LLRVNLVVLLVLGVQSDHWIAGTLLSAYKPFWMGKKSLSDMFNLRINWATVGIFFVTTFPRNVYYYHRKLRNIGESSQNSDMKPYEKRSDEPCWLFMHKGSIRRIAKSLNESPAQP